MSSTPTWARDAVLYHLYPLGLCGAPRHAPLDATPVPRLHKLVPWLEHAADLGCTAVQFGPVFESEEHGYDVVDLWRVDRRLGTSHDLARVCDQAHRLGLKVVFDAVFNHVGRASGAFQALLEHGKDAATVGWFKGLDFTKRSAMGDPFAYEAWAGHDSLVKLDVQHPAVREHLLHTVDHWIDAYGVDGLRLDAADVLDRRFLRALRKHTDARGGDVWLCGEVVHGDYNRWASTDRLHSVTSYQAYKALWSSHVDRNYWELAHALQVQFGPEGRYRDLNLLSFVDNHDQPRIASRLSDARHLYPLHLALFTMPGIPSIYYGSEWGIQGVTAGDHDWDLRPELDLDDATAWPHPDLPKTIRRLAELRRALPALRLGSYQQRMVANEQLVFARITPEQRVLVALNSGDHAVDVNFPATGAWRDALEQTAPVTASGGSLTLSLPPSWGRVLVNIAP